jgi:hypothetical protein
MRIAVVLVLMLAVLVALTSPAYAAPEAKVTICHATSSVNNPYNEITVNANAINGHSGHTGPIFPETDANGNWGDIIPTFTYSNGTVFPGLNWDTEGMDVLEAGCQVDLTPIEPPIEPTTTTTSSTTTTTLPPTTTTTTTLAPITTTTTTSPGSTTTPTTSSSTTTTTVPITPTVPPTVAPPSEVPPPVVDPPDGVEIVPPTEAIVIDPGDKVVDLGQLTPSERVSLEAELDALAFTGTNTVLTVGAGALVLMLGAILTLLASRRRRTK